MFEKSFYTKEFKELVKALKNNGQLNRTSLNNVDRELVNKAIKCSIANFILFILLFLTEGIFTAFVALIFFALLSFIDMRLWSKKICDISLLVTYGHRASGYILKHALGLSYLTTYPAHIFTYDYNVCGERYVGGHFKIPKYFHSEKYPENTAIYVFYSSDDTKKSIPALPWLVSQFDLKKGK